VGGDYLNEYHCDFAKKSVCSPDKWFIVVLVKGILLNKISPFGVNFLEKKCLYSNSNITD